MCTNGGHLENPNVYQSGSVVFLKQKMERDGVVIGDEMVVFTEVITFILDIFWVCFGAFCSSYFYTNSRKYSHLKSLTIYC